MREKKTRGHPGLNQGPLDLQSNALPLSYIPCCRAPKLSCFVLVSPINNEKRIERYINLRTENQSLITEQTNTVLKPISCDFDVVLFIGRKTLSLK